MLTKAALKSHELKFDDETRSVTGYGSVWDRVDSYGDTVEKGAFTKSIDGMTSLPMLYQHDSSQVIGKWVSLEEDDHGLLVKGEFTPGHSLASDVYASLKHGSIDGLSIGFKITDSEEKDDGRILRGIDLKEISVVTFPAETAARIGEVKFDEIKTIRDIEDFARSQGLSRNNAKRLVAEFRNVFQREAEAKQAENEALRREADIADLNLLIESQLRKFK